MDIGELAKLRNSNAPRFLDSDAMQAIEAWREVCFGDDVPFLGAHEASVATAHETMIDLAVGVSGFLGIEEGRRGLDGHLQKDSKQAEARASMYDRALGEAIVLGELITGQDTGSVVPRTWYKPEFEGGGNDVGSRLGVVGGILEGRKRRRRATLDQFLERNPAIDPVELFNATVALALQHDLAKDGMLTRMGIFTLCALDEDTRWQVGLPAALRHWEGKVRRIDGTADSMDFVARNKELVASMMKKLAVMTDHDAVSPAEQARAKFILDIQSGFDEASEPRRARVAELVEAANLVQARQMAAILRTDVTPQAEAPAVEEPRPVDTESKELEAKLVEQQREWPEVHRKLLNAWRLSKDVLREFNLGEVNRRLINPGELRGRTPQGFDKETAKLVLGLVWHANSPDPTVMQENLQSCMQTEAKGLETYRDITEQLRKAGNAFRPEAFPVTLRDVLDKMQDRWHDVETIVEDIWPKSVPLHMEMIRNVLFFEALEDKPATGQPEHTAPALTESAKEPESDPAEAAPEAEPQPEAESQPEMPEIPEVKAELAPTEIIPLFDSIAEQLEWEVLPPGDKMELLRAEISRHYPPHELDRIDWRRMEHLVSLQEMFGGKLYRSKESSLGTLEPYFVHFFELSGKKYGLAECPQYGNATYIVREDLTPGTREEVLGIAKRDARAVGAVRVLHTDQARHRQKLIDKIQSLAIIAR